MRVERHGRKAVRASKGKQGLSSIALVVSVLQATQALRWERVFGGPSAGIGITDERPFCRFSPTYQYIEPPDNIELSGIRRDSEGRLIEYYLVGTGNEYRIETHVYNATFNLVSLVTDFKKHRYYLTAGFMWRDAVLPGHVQC